MASSVKRIGLLAASSKEIIKVLENHLPSHRYQLCEIKYDPNLFSNPCSKDTKAAIEKVREDVDAMEILIADARYMFSFLDELKQVKWIQLVWAGVEPLIHSRGTKPAPPMPITRFGGIFGDHMAEYTISNIINFERGAFRFHDNQNKSYWELNEGVSVGYRMLSELTITILGCGDIGCVIARHCKQFGATVYGMVSKKKEDKEGYVDEYFTPSELPFYLKKSHYICNVLPSTVFTKDVLTADVVRHCKDAVFINIGRGDVIAENVLVEAVEKKWFKGAVLDVFAVEPLPTDSKLWNLPNVHLTPHVAGLTQPRHVAECFLKQLKLYENNQTLNFLIDWNKGY